MRRSCPALVLAVSVLVAGAADPALASRKPSKAEAKAVKKAFFKKHTGATSRITKIRMSTKVTGVAGVTYRRKLTLAGATSWRKLPAPAFYKKGKKGFGPMKTVPAKAKKELGGAATSSIRLTGDVTETLTRFARCSSDRDSYSASIYNAASGNYFDVSLPSISRAWHGPGAYPARAVWSVASFYPAMDPGAMWETGQPSDATESSGTMWIQGEGRGGGLIEADMARAADGSAGTLSVHVSGTWTCG